METFQLYFTSPKDGERFPAFARVALKVSTLGERDLRMLTPRCNSTAEFDEVIEVLVADLRKVQKQARERFIRA